MDRMTVEENNISNLVIGRVPVSLLRHIKTIATVTLHGFHFT